MEEVVKSGPKPGPVEGSRTRPLLSGSGEPVWPNVEERLARARRLEREVVNSLRSVIESRAAAPVESKVVEALREELSNRKAGFDQMLDQFKACELARDRLFKGLESANKDKAAMQSQIKELASRVSGLTANSEAVTSQLNAKSAELSVVRQKLAKELESKASDMFYAQAKRSLEDTEAAFHELWALVGGEAKWDPKNALGCFREALRRLGARLDTPKEADKALAERVKKLESERDEAMSLALSFEAALTKSNDALFEERRSRMKGASK